VRRADRRKAVRAWQAGNAEAAKADAVVHHERWFFVVHLSGERARRAGAPYEVQLLDDAGRAREVAAFSASDCSVELGGSSVPVGVLRAATELAEGQGCYVDGSGWEVTPVGHRVAPELARATGGLGQNRG
jgi:hypothetical protein